MYILYLRDQCNLFNQDLHLKEISARDPHLWVIQESRQSLLELTIGRLYLSVRILSCLM